jgi:hypothetical protein
MEFSIGDLVKMTDDALENYGEEWKDTVFTITNAAKSVHDHPGYDESIYPQVLYDLKVYETDEDFPNSLYDWELTYA